MTLDEQDVINAALARMSAALVCLGQGYTEGKPFEGALFSIGDAQNALETLMKAQRGNSAALGRKKSPKLSA
jgi:hypothetical protein